MIWFDYTPDYVAIIATQAAIVEDATSGPRPPDPKCEKCGGTGKVRTGDGQGWTACECTDGK